MIAKRMGRQKCPDSPTIEEWRMKLPLQVMSRRLLKRCLVGKIRVFNAVVPQVRLDMDL
jgi:hypothetical protein